MEPEMDMDIPLPEELEWLEANSHLQDDYEDFEPYPEDEDELELKQQEQPPDHSNQQQQKTDQAPSKPTIAIPPKPTTDPSTCLKTNSNGKKRFRSDDPNSRNSDGQVQLEDKRSRIHELETENDDEDWMRYSPPPPDTAATEVAEPVIVEEKIISRYATEIDGNFIPVTGLDGDRVYAKTSSVVEDRVKKLDFKTHSFGLISEPIHILLQKAEKEAFTKALQASVGQSDTVLPETPVVNEDLWVKKYAPRSFMELLSDEQTNREVLMWLKQWDSCVFGSEMRNTTDDVLSSLKMHSSVAQHQKLSSRSFPGKYRESRFGQGGGFHAQNNLDQVNNDFSGNHESWKQKVKDSGPPEQKILLLCGSPGLGKTTLAHVAARHCGYRVVEINASDDRSSSTIERKIQDVVQMNSVMADSMPKCLVIDEIDGALGDGKGAVEVILKMLSAERKSDAVAAKEKQTGKSSKKKQRSASLLRPVICICNDLYAPALRPLRQVAKVHVFVQPTVSRVVNRLKYICTKEGLKASSTALTTLAQYTECDIRSCLNTLQFLHKKKEAINVLDISSQVVGMKDTSKSFFDIWKEIFQKRKVKRETKLSNGCSNVFNEFQSVLSLISNRGDYDTILDGIHENMLQLHYHDPLMRKTVKCLHSLGVSDLTHQYIMRSQKMSLQVYQPAIAITVRGLVAQNERPNIEWPKSFHRYRMGLMEKIDNLRSWHCKISPNVSRHLSIKSFVEDSISPLLHILSPSTLRPVAVYILSENEKNDMAQLVDTMVSYSITYKSLKSEPPTTTLRREAVSDDPVFSFDPPISDFINFKGYTSGHFVLSAAVKQVLLHEVEKQNIIRGSMRNSWDPKYTCDKANQTLSVAKDDRPQSSMLGFAPSRDNAKTTPNLEQSKPTSRVSSASGSTSCATATSLPLSSQKVMKKPCGGSFNYFDRFRKLSSSSSQVVANESKPATSERDSRPLLFKFNEGFTNAVKRPVRIRDFLV